MQPTSLKDISNNLGIPVVELGNLLASKYGTETRLPAPMSYKHTGFALDVIQTIRKEISEFFVGRSDFIKNMDRAYRLIMCNMVCCVFDRTCLSLSGSEKDYNNGTYYKKLFLTWASVDSVTKALIACGYIKKNQGSKATKQVNNYFPTKKLELLVLPLIYMVSEDYKPTTELIIFKETKQGKEAKATTTNIGTMRRSSFELETNYRTDIEALTRINKALQDCTYALKSPVKRIYSENNPSKGGRLYTRLQGLPDRRARIRINTLLNGEPVAEVDLSANHPRMIMALANKVLSPSFYDDVAKATDTTREQVKFLLVKAIGAKNRRISLKPKGADKAWLSNNFVLLPKERNLIESHLKENYKILFESLYRGMGTALQAFEGDILLAAMLDLLDHDIVSLPMHDAIYVQQRFKKHAQVALENAWMMALNVPFKPFTKIDLPD